MSKVWTCDICEKREDLDGTLRPDGWGKLKIDHRWNGNLGGQIINFDLCCECTRTSFQGFRAKLIETIKSLKQKREFGDTENHN